MNCRIAGALVVLAVLVSRLAAQTYTFASVSAPASAVGGLAFDSAGNLFVADVGAHVIWKVAPNGDATRFAGNSGARGSANGNGEAARFNQPRGLAFDAQGNLYVADAGNDLIRRITPSGDVTTLAGVVGGGTANGDPAVARFDTPWALAVDAAGNVIVADRDNLMVRVVSTGGTVRTLAGFYYYPYYERRSAIDGAGSAAKFYDPVGLALDREGNVYVADGPALIRKITPAGVVSTIAGNPNSQGSVDGSGVAAQFRGPTGLALAPSGEILIADTTNRTLRSLSPSGAVRTLAGQVQQTGTADGVGGLTRFTAPQLLAVGPNGILVVAEEDRAVLRRGTPFAGAVPPILHAPPVPRVTVGANTAFTLSVGASGTEPLTYQWLKNTALIPGATNSALAFASAIFADEGTYAVRVSNAAGSVVSNPTPVSVFTPRLTSFTSRRSVPGGSFLWGIAASPSQLAAVGTGGTILTSSDGRRWERRDAGTADWLVGIAYSAGTFVAVGDRGTILLSRDGVTWRRVGAGITNQRLNNVTFGTQAFVAVGERGTILSSPDGETWTARNSGVQTWLRGVSYQPFAPLPQFTPAQTGPNVFAFTSGDNGSARFYACGENGVMLSSSDGGTWTGGVLLPATTGKTPDLEALAFGPAAIGEDGALVHSAAFPITQVLAGKTPSFPGGFTSVTYSTQMYLEWTKTYLGIAARFRGLARGAGATFAMGENGMVAASPSFYGPWALLPTGTSANLVAAVFRGESLFVVGENETILESDPLFNSRLMNLSTRARVTGDARPMISGFVVTGTGRKTVLVRAAGPGLAALGIPQALSAPDLALFDSTGRIIAQNAGWSSAQRAAIVEAVTRVGAFPFATGSSDSALLATLDPGAYTVRVIGAGGAAGVALVEIYDAETPTNDSPRAVNLSTRGHVGVDADRLISGFVVAGADSRQILVRAIGPSLASFGVSDLLAEPKLEVFDARGYLIAESSGPWGREQGTEKRTAAAQAGAFALPEGSADAVLVRTFTPGSYTVQVSGLRGTTGAALIEIYDAP